MVNIDVNNVGENSDTVCGVERKDVADSVCNPNSVGDNSSDCSRDVYNNSLSDECSDHHTKL